MNVPYHVPQIALPARVLVTFALEEDAESWTLHVLFALLESHLLLVCLGIECVPKVTSLEQKAAAHESQAPSAPTKHRAHSSTSVGNLSANGLLATQAASSTRAESSSRAGTTAQKGLAGSLPSCSATAASAALTSAGGIGQQILKVGTLLDQASHLVFATAARSSLQFHPTVIASLSGWCLGTGGANKARNRFCVREASESGLSQISKRW